MAASFELGHDRAGGIPLSQVSVLIVGRSR
jgi:hypothetical protein